MTKRPFIEWIVLALNTIGLIGYLFWLVFQSRKIFYSQDGVLYLLPCVVFFFVFAYLLRRKPEPPDGHAATDNQEGAES